MAVSRKAVLAKKLFYLVDAGALAVSVFFLALSLSASVHRDETTPKIVIDRVEAEVKLLRIDRAVITIPRIVIRNAGGKPVDTGVTFTVVVCTNGCLYHIFAEKLSLEPNETFTASVGSPGPVPKGLDVPRLPGDYFFEVRVYIRGASTLELLDSASVVAGPIPRAGVGDNVTYRNGRETLLMRVNSWWEEPSPRDPGRLKRVVLNVTFLNAFSNGTVDTGYVIAHAMSDRGRVAYGNVSELSYRVLGPGEEVTGLIYIPAPKDFIPVEVCVCGVDGVITLKKPESSN